MRMLHANAQLRSGCVVHGGLLYCLLSKPPSKQQQPRVNKTTVIACIFALRIHQNSNNRVNASCTDSTPKTLTENHAEDRRIEGSGKKKGTHRVCLANDIVLNVRPVQLDEVQRTVLPSGGYPFPFVVIDSGSAPQLQRSGRPQLDHLSSTTHGQHTQVKELLGQIIYR